MFFLTPSVDRKYLPIFGYGVKFRKNDVPELSL